MHNLHFAIYICICEDAAGHFYAWHWQHNCSVYISYLLFDFLPFHYPLERRFQLVENSEIVNIFPCHRLLYFPLAIIQLFASISIINWTNCTSLSRFQLNSRQRPLISGFHLYYNQWQHAETIRRDYRNFLFRWVLSKVLSSTFRRSVVQRVLLIAIVKWNFDMRNMRASES